MTTRQPLLFGLLLSTAFFLAACGRTTTAPPAPPPACALDFPRLGLCGQLRWNETPAPRRALTGTLTFVRRGNLREAVNVQAELTGPITVVPFMPSHGHGTPRVVTVTAGASGSWLLGNVFFTMAGPWEVRVTLPARGGNETAKLDITL